RYVHRAAVELAARDLAGRVPTGTLACDRPGEARLVRQRILERHAVGVADAVVPDRHREADRLADVHLRGVRLLLDVNRRGRHADGGLRLTGAVVARRHRGDVVHEATVLLTVAAGRLVRDRGDVTVKFASPPVALAGTFTGPQSSSLAWVISQVEFQP